MSNNPTLDLPGDPGRKKFLTSGLQLAGAALLLPVAGFPLSPFSRKETYTVRDIQNLMIKTIPGAPFKETVDTLKSGSADQEVTAIVTTMFATISVIEQAAQRGANFIIAHEPSYYNHEDNTGYVKKNEVLQKKLDLINKHHICIWRFHDYCHALKPDAITYGVVKKLGWLPHYQPGEMVLDLPPQRFQDLVHYLKKCFGVDHVRVIGDPGQVCSRVGIMAGAWGGQPQITLLEDKHPDVIVVGEIHEWELGEYIRDARLLGGKPALVILGHSVSEEPGMEWIQQWLAPQVPGLTVTHIASGSPFSWM